jgi:hypothetical protein
MGKYTDLVHLDMDDTLLNMFRVVRFEVFTVVTMKNGVF